jgi:hypothetical protein
MIHPPLGVQSGPEPVGRIGPGRSPV